ncbi:hypothetical protein SNEBB_009756 [Seison nebaliae]|nr:hypothetical protein SNEBB_009756 [Seison nebaliae]
MFKSKLRTEKIHKLTSQSIVIENFFKYFLYQQNRHKSTNNWAFLLAPKQFITENILVTLPDRLASLIDDHPVNIRQPSIRRSLTSCYYRIQSIPKVTLDILHITVLANLFLVKQQPCSFTITTSKFIKFDIEQLKSLIETLMNNEEKLQNYLEMILKTNNEFVDSLLYQSEREIKSKLLFYKHNNANEEIQRNELLKSLGRRIISKARIDDVSSVTLGNNSEILRSISDLYSKDIRTINFQQINNNWQYYVEENVVRRSIVSDTVRLQFHFSETTPSPSLDDDNGISPFLSVYSELHHLSELDHNNFICKNLMFTDITCQSVRHIHQGISSLYEIFMKSTRNKNGEKQLEISISLPSTSNETDENAISGFIAQIHDWNKQNYFGSLTTNLKNDENSTYSMKMISCRLQRLIKEKEEYYRSLSKQKFISELKSIVDSKPSSDTLYVNYNQQCNMKGLMGNLNNLFLKKTSTRQIHILWTPTIFNAHRSIYLNLTIRRSNCEIHKDILYKLPNF